MMMMNDVHSDTGDANGDGEGVWSPDIEQCFREALILYPACGRRKHIIQEEGGGKMYGRNELIAKYIFDHTGKVRSRKQVSSHIQVLARRKAKTEAAKNGGGVTGDEMDESSSPGSSIAMSVGSGHGGPHSQTFYDMQTTQINRTPLPPPKRVNLYFDTWADRPIATKKFRLVEFSAFIEYRRQLELQHQPPASAAAAAAAFHGLTPGHAPAITLTSLASAAATDNNGHHAMNVAAAAAAAAVAASSTTNGELATTNLMGASSAAASYLADSNALSQSSSPHNPHYLHNPHHHHHHQPVSGQFSHQITTHEAYPHVTNASQLQQPLNNNNQHHQQLNQSDYMLSPNMAQIGLNNYPQQHQQHQHASATSVGITRHSYVKIDYRQASVCRQSTKLECIDIGQIQDKFPEILGSEGLYQRGPSDAFFLVKFWADINNDYECQIEDQNSYFGFSSSFEALEPFKEITCSTKACSYGSQVVEKIEKIQCALNSSNGRYLYEIGGSPMCEFMIQFIKKLRQLPRTSQMNSVLENFSVLQVVQSEATAEILLCLAFVFEIAPSEQKSGSQYHVYKLTKD